MLHLVSWLLFLPIMVSEPMVEASEAVGPACPGDYTCVGNEDLKSFVQLLQDHKCRTETLPIVTADSVVIVVDRQGRVYGSGTGPKPFTLHLKWCNYEINATSEIHLDVAQRVEPQWGFRLRIKAAVGVLVADAFSADKLYEALDGGIMVEPFFIQWANLNGFVGFRSFGAGVGVDWTTNFGGYLGYALTWGTWRSNPYLGVSFAF